MVKMGTGIKMATELKLEDILKAKENVNPIAVKPDFYQYVDNYLTKVVRIMELGNSILQNAQKIKDMLPQQAKSSSAIQQMEEIIKEKEKEVPKVTV